MPRPFDLEMLTIYLGTLHLLEAGLLEAASLPATDQLHMVSSLTRTSP